MALPRRRADLVAVELRDDGAQSIETHEMRRHMLPREEEAHEIVRRHRLDLGAQSVERVAMNPRKQAAVAPLGEVFRSGGRPRPRRGGGRVSRAFGAAGGRGRPPLREASAQHDAFVFEFEQREIRVVLADVQRCRECARRRRSDE